MSKQSHIQRRTDSCRFKAAGTIVVVVVGLSLSPFPQVRLNFFEQGKKKQRKGNKGKYILRWAQPAILPSLSSSSAHSSPRGATKTVLPTLVSLMKVNTTGVALWSLTLPAPTGPPVRFSHSPLILFHMTHTWLANAGHSVTWRNLDWCSPVSHHQHLSELILCILCRYDPIAAWPGRNW